MLWFWPRHGFTEATPRYKLYIEEVAFPYPQPWLELPLPTDCTYTLDCHGSNLHQCQCKTAEVKMVQQVVNSLDYCNAKVFW